MKDGISKAKPALSFITETKAYFAFVTNIISVFPRRIKADGIYTTSEYTLFTRTSKGESPKLIDMYSAAGKRGPGRPPPFDSPRNFPQFSTCNANKSLRNDNNNNNTTHVCLASLNQCRNNIIWSLWCDYLLRTAGGAGRGVPQGVDGEMCGIKRWSRVENRLKDAQRCSNENVEWSTEDYQNGNNCTTQLKGLDKNRHLI